MVTLAVAACGFATCGWAATAATPNPVDPSAERIAAIQKAIRGAPGSPQPYIDLAQELCRKARDSEDVRYYSQADSELATALRLSPGNYAARKVQTEVLLGKRELDAALKLATELNRKVPDDLAVWGLLAEINSSLGNYEEALRDAQWVVDLRPGSTLGFIEAARLRELYGDAEGAIEFYDEARRRTPLSDAEEISWLIAKVGLLRLQTGDKTGAGTLFDEALRLNPQSQLATAGRARLLSAQGNYQEAIAVLQERHKVVRDARTQYDLAEALEAGGRKEEALAAFRDFEKQARDEAGRPYNADLDLIRYYTDRKADSAAALSIAKRASAVRHDLPTMAALAWALNANGRYEEARKAMEEALSAGLRNAAFFCEAAHISAMLKDTAHAAEYRKDSLAMDPQGCAEPAAAAFARESNR